MRQCQVQRLTFNEDIPRYLDCGLHYHLRINLVAVVNDTFQVLKLTAVHFLDLYVPVPQIVVCVLKLIYESIVLYCEPFSKLFLIMCVCSDCWLFAFFLRFTAWLFLLIAKLGWCLLWLQGSLGRNFFFRC